MDQASAVPSVTQSAAPVMDSAAQAPATAQGYTGNTAPAPDAAPAPQATAQATDPTPDSPTQATQGDDKADKRVSDAQRQMHAATQRAAALEQQLAQILNHPLLGPVVQKAQAASQEAAKQAGEDPLVLAYKEYQQAPDDQTAFAKLVGFAEKRAEERVMTELEKRGQAAEQKRRDEQRDALIVQTINKKVEELAPEIPLRFFWSMAERAEMETPRELTDPPARLQWQVNRGIELARAELEAAWGKRAEAQTQQAGLRQAAAAVMPSGGAAPQASSQSSSTPSTFVDQIKANQRAQWK